jgi:hypothetical protein
MTRSAAAAAGLKFRGWPMIIQTLGLGEKSARLQKHWEALYMRIKERDMMILPERERENTLLTD